MIGPGDSFDEVMRAGLHLVDCQRKVTTAKAAYHQALRQLEHALVPLPEIRAALRASDELDGRLAPVFHTNRWDRDQLTDYGFSPATLIDVGAASGTDVIQEAFPGAHHVLIEPLEEFADDLRQLVAEHGGEYLAVAVGSEETRRTLHVDRQMLAKTSFHERRPELTSPEPPEEREVRITTLDRLWDEKGWSGPFGVKIDTKGFDDEVIRGAPRLLAQTEFVISEVSVAERFPDSSSFVEFVTLMKEHAFVLTDVLAMARTADLRTLLYMDAIFRREPPPGTVNQAGAGHPG